MARFKRGDRVEIADRPAAAADRKSGLYYNHFRGLRGVVDQVYEQEGEICVEVDQDGLPPDFLRRHQAIQEQARRKWLSGLSEQERRGLPEEHRDLRLKYTVIVAPDDLAPEGRSKERKPAPRADSAAPAAGREEPEKAGGAPSPSGAASDGGAAAPAPAQPQAAAPRARRPTEADLAAQEEAHLQELLRRTGKA